MPNNDRRLIEDLIPIREISAEASREKSLRHGNISTLHLWWARRPIVAARAAVYGALVPAPLTPRSVISTWRVCANSAPGISPTASLSRRAKTSLMPTVVNPACPRYVRGWRLRPTRSPAPGL